MIRIVCRELVLAASGTITETKLLSFDVADPALEDYLKSASDASLRRVEDGYLVPQAPAVPTPVPPDPSTLLLDVPAGVPVDANLIGFTILHGGESYYTPNMTPEGGAIGGRMLFDWTRQFASWSKVEAARGVYTWGTVASKADYYAARSLKWSLVLTPVSPPYYGGPVKGPPPTEQPYRDYLLNAMRTFWGKGLRAIEICNEPETDNWYGSLGRKPVGNLEIRRVARELSPWARVAKEAAGAYFTEAGNRVEIWGTSSQSMANADPETGLARVFNDPSEAADKAFAGTGFLNGSDGKGGKGAQWLDRFTFHGYPNPTHDSTMLHAHFLKAKAWLAAAGRPALPIVVTEHGVLSDRNPSNGDRATGTFREWKTDNPYTGKTPPFTDRERTRWVLNAFGISAIHGARMLFYGWDERYMGIYGYANGPQGGSPTAALGWVPNHVEIEEKHKILREKLLGKKAFTLWKRDSDGLLTLLVGDARSTATLLALE